MSRARANLRGAKTAYLGSENPHDPRGFGYARVPVAWSVPQAVLAPELHPVEGLLVHGSQRPQTVVVAGRWSGRKSGPTSLQIWDVVRKASGSRFPREGGRGAGIEVEGLRSFLS